MLFLFWHCLLAFFLFVYLVGEKWCFLCSLKKNCPSSTHGCQVVSHSLAYFLLGFFFWISHYENQLYDMIIRSSCLELVSANTCVFYLQQHLRPYRHIWNSSYHYKQLLSFVLWYLLQRMFLFSIFFATTNMIPTTTANIECDTCKWPKTEKM